MPQIESKQNFYHLFCIQCISIGIPALVIGKELFTLFDTGTAICSIVVGNLILWLIGLAIVTMVYHENSNAIKNIGGYLGQTTAILFALVLTLAFLDWYVIMINKSITSLETIYQYSYPWGKGSAIKIGATIGFLTALLAIGGINLLKWLTSLSFPIVLLYHLYIISSSDFSLFHNLKWGLSSYGVITTVLLLLPGAINLPTFFRHSRSRAHSFLALTCMVLFISFFECSSMWMSFSPESKFILNGKTIPSFLTYVIPTTLFLLITVVTTNLVNIYLASACYETFIKRFEGTKGYAIMGLLGTAMYTFVQISGPVKFIENLLNDYIAVLGVVLVIAVLSRIIVRHRPRRFEKIINSASWLIGCAVATVLQVKTPLKGIGPLLMGMGSCVLFFLIVFFVEETVWSVQKLRKGDASST